MKPREHQKHAKIVAEHARKRWGAGWEYLSPEMRRGALAEQIVSLVMGFDGAERAYGQPTAPSEVTTADRVTAGDIACIAKIVYELGGVAGL